MFGCPALALGLALSLALAVAAGGSAGPKPPGEPDPSPVVVSAAASLSDVLQQLAAAYERGSTERVTLNFGASNTLARQIAAGARVDLFVSADEAQMDVVAADIDPSSRVAMVSNQLAIAVPDDRPRRFLSARDLAGPTVRRIAMGDPSAVPAGVYAKVYLERLGVWDAVAAKVVPSGSVRLALAAVENGAADAAIVYKTDIATARRVREAYVVSPADGPRIVYPAAVVRGGRNEEGGRRFLRFLVSAEATAVFERAGFLRP
jgi:molybdate transport system substrate-binding protein